MKQEAEAARVLALNGGSSSIRFAAYGLGDTSGRVLLHGHLSRIGLPGTTLTVADGQHSPTRVPVAVADQPAAVAFLLDWLEQHAGFSTIRAVGHRVVHGMAHHAPERITPELVAELRRCRAFDPDHLPGQLALIEGLQQRHPQLPQFACFDTAFHHDMPRVAQLLPLPRRFEAQGLRRYGFHGISCAYLLEELGRLAGSAVANGRVLLAHLGSGASLAAVHHGRSLDAQVPPLAFVALQAQYPQARNVQWKRAQGWYQASYTQSQVRRLVRFNPNGEVRATGTAVALGTLPLPVRLTLTNRYPSRKFCQADQITNARTKGITYEMATCEHFISSTVILTANGVKVSPAHREQ